MVKQTRSLTLILFSFLLLFILTEVEGTKKSYGVYAANPVKLFVFGDSYVDTGNFATSGAFKPPFGITYPGKPSGRFSDGRVLSDYIASFLNIETPIAYRLKNSSNIQNGINFAYGGTGVFKTLVDGPNMSVQIDSFQQLIDQKVFSKSDIESSVALVSASGNDYIASLRNGKILNPPAFIESLVNQISQNIKRINSLGINKVLVGLLPPIGCLPALNVVSFRTSCIGPLNDISKNHNSKLLQAVQDLNKESGKTVFITLDLYDSFLSTIETMKKQHDENSTLMNPLAPCCDEWPLIDACGSVDSNGKKQYRLCPNPKLSFFWNTVHPSQNGWSQVYTILKSSLNQLIEKNF